VLNGYFGKVISLETPQKITVLITYFDPLRIEKINHQIRNIVKCNFVDKIIISNHNPDFRIEDRVSIKDERLIFLNQDVKRACGYRWQIVKQLHFEYLVVIDDDMLLFPTQLKTLCEQLILEPEVPHGFSGMVYLGTGEYEYHEKENAAVDFLCEVYAITKAHVGKYFEMQTLLAKEDKSLLDAIEHLGDYVVISQTGTHNPRIHKVGKLFRQETFKMPGVANHQDEAFKVVLARVSEAVEKIRHQISAEVSGIDAASIESSSFGRPKL
jgi:hypothetical protein